MKQIGVVLLCLLLTLPLLVVSGLASALIPSALTAVDNGDETVTLSWIQPDSPNIIDVLNNIVRKSVTDFPLSRTEGDILVYDDVDITTYTDDISGNLDYAEYKEEPLILYYSVWTEYTTDTFAGGYITVGMGAFTPIASTAGTDETTDIWSDAANVSLDIGGSNMPNVVMMGIFIFLALVPTIAAFALKSGRGILGFVAAGAWLLLGIFSYMQSEETWDIYYGLFWLSMGMVFVCSLIAVVLKEKKEEEITEDYGEDKELMEQVEADEKDREKFRRIYGSRRGRARKGGKLSNFAKTGREKIK